MGYVNPLEGIGKYTSPMDDMDDINRVSILHVLNKKRRQDIGLWPLPVDEVIRPCWRNRLEGRKFLVIFGSKVDEWL